MKILGLIGVFYLLLLTLQKPVCCEDCNRGYSVLSIPKPKTLTSKISVKCHNKNVCAIQCKDIHTPCGSQRVFYEIKGKRRLGALAYYYICLKRVKSSSPDEKERESDTLWAKMLGVIQRKHPKLYGYIERRNLLKYGDALAYTQLLDGEKYTKAGALVSLVGMIRSFRKVCHKTEKPR